MLKPPNHNSSSNSQFMSKPANRYATQRSKPQELFVFALGNQKITRKRISLEFLLAFGQGVGFDKKIPLAVQKDVSCFVKESEPKVIVCLVAQAQLYQSV